MVEAGDTYRHGEYGHVAVLDVRTAMDTVPSDGALTKTRVVAFDSAYDPADPGAGPAPAAVETEPLDAFIANTRE